MKQKEQGGGNPFGQGGSFGGGFQEFFQFFGGGGGGPKGGHTFHFEGGPGGRQQHHQQHRQQQQYPLMENMFGDEEQMPVKEISENAFKSFNGFQVLFFYSAACGEACRKVKDPYISFASSTKAHPTIKVSAINCDASKNNNQLCKKLNNQPIKSPVIKMYQEVVDSNDGGISEPKFLSAMNRPQINIKELNAWMSGAIPVKVDILNAANLEQWLDTNHTIPHIITFTNRPIAPLPIKLIAAEYDGKIKLGLFNTASASAGQTKVLLEYFNPPTTSFGFSTLSVTNLDDPLEGGEWILNGDSAVLSLKLHRIVMHSKRAKNNHLNEAAGVFELTSRRMNRGECGPNDTAACFILFAKHNHFIKDEYLSALTSAAESFSNVRTGYVTETSQPSFIYSVLHDLGSEITTKYNTESVVLVAIKAKRKRAKIFEGDLGNLEALKTFVEGVASGSALNGKLSEVPLLLPSSPLKFLQKTQGGNNKRRDNDEL